MLERENGPVSTVDGRIAHTDGATAASLGETDLTSRVRVDSAEGGKVVFARLGWPGYRASIDGRDVPISVVAKTFVAVEIPPGTQGAELVLSWRPPGWKIGGAAIVAGLLGLAALEWAYLRGRRRDTDEPAADSSTAPEAPEPERPDLVEARP